MSNFYLRAFALVSLVSLLGGLTPMLHPAPTQGQNLALVKVYEYKEPRRWKGRMHAVLDTQNRFLYIVEWEMGVVKQIDWRSGKQTREVDFSELPCDRGYFAEMWKKIKDAERIGSWWPIPGTPYASMGYCGSQYIVDTRTLRIVRDLSDFRQEGGWTSFDFLPKSGFVLVRRGLPQENVVPSELYRFDTWELVRKWDYSKNSRLLLSQDEKYAFYLNEHKGPDGKPGGCEVSVEELTTGHPIEKWQLQEGPPDCPLALRFWGSSSDIVVDWTTSAHVVVSLRNIRTGKVLRTIRLEGAFPKSTDISPDGKYVVAGAWNDPQDSPVSQDFKIWDLGTGEVVYETTKYRSVWGSRTHGREVHPSFSYDGKYLILVKERSVELLQINSSASSTAAK